MKKLSVLFSFLASASAFASSSYFCNSGQDAFTLSVDGTNSVSISTESTPEVPVYQNTEGRYLSVHSAHMREVQLECLPKGSGGVLTANSSGPNLWSFRTPIAAFQGASLITLQLAWDEDSDGLACQYISYECKKNN